MNSYHINPKTGNPGICRAKEDKCPFAASEEHFSSKEEARTGYELIMQERLLTINFPKMTIHEESKGIPKSILDKFSSHKNFISPIDVESVLEKEFKENQKLYSLLSKENLGNLSRYTFVSYKVVNHFLRTNLKKLKEKEGHFFPLQPDEEIELDLNNRLTRLDESFRVYESNFEEKERRLYRFMKVPKGISSKEFLDNSFNVGEVMQDKAYLSTSLDPEFIVASMFDERDKGLNFNYVMFEIVSNKGLPLQNEKDQRSGNVQSLELERLLPRDLKLRVVNKNFKQKVRISEERKQLKRHFSKHFNNDYDYLHSAHFKKLNSGVTIPLIQFIDEDLLNEES